MFNPNGTISPEAFKSIAASPRFNMQATQFEIGDIQQTRNAGALPLTSAPNVIGWNKLIPGPGLADNNI
jgi:hypothetical protein